MNVLEIAAEDEEETAPLVEPKAQFGLEPAFQGLIRDFHAKVSDSAC
jgi:hypothetical protein